MSEQYIFKGISFNELSILQKALEEKIFSLSQDRFYAEQAERYSDADDAREKLKEANKVRKRLKLAMKYFIDKGL